MSFGRTLLLAILSPLAAFAGLADDPSDVDAWARFVSPDDGDLVVGLTEFRFEVDDSVGVERIDVYVQEKLVGTAEPPRWSFMWNATTELVGETIVAAVYRAEGEPRLLRIVTSSATFDERIDVVQVQLFPVVFDRKGRYVEGLTQDDFRVLDGGHPVEIDSFEQEPASLSLAVMIDGSESMLGKVGLVKDASCQLVDRLAPDDHVSVYSFNHAVDRRQPLSRDHAAVKAAIRSVDPVGGTAVYDAIVRVLEDFETIRGRKAIVLFSDGRDERSITSLSRAVELARRSEVIVYAIGAGRSREDKEAREDLRALADETGGVAHFLDRIKQLPSIYDRILEHLRAQYSLSFTPAETSPGEHRIVVAVRDASLTVRSRKSYFYPGPSLPALKREQTAAVPVARPPRSPREAAPEEPVSGPPPATEALDSQRETRRAARPVDSGEVRPAEGHRLSEPVAFETLLLGVVQGRSPIQLAVGDGVATVSLLLNGEECARLEGGPWLASCDLGRLRTHEVTAVALDDAGAEIGRARQWVNVRRKRVESALFLETDAAGVPTAVRWLWESVELKEPVTVDVAVDGRTLESTGDGRFPLPRLDLDRPHFVVATASFEDGSTTRSELVYGGENMDSASVELTAVPVRAGGRESLSLSDCVGTLRGRTGRLRVTALDQGLTRVVVVIEEKAGDALELLAPELEERAPRVENRLRTRLGDEVSVQATVPEAAEAPGTTRRLFPITPPYRLPGRSLPLLLARLRPVVERGEEQIADSVAVAGVEAAGNRARVLVLVSSGASRDESRWAPEDVRRFLAELRVPLYVWSTWPGGERDSRWGPTIDVSTAEKLNEAVSGLRRDLDRQAIVWVEGRHLLRDIVLHGPAPFQLVE